MMNVLTFACLLLVTLVSIHGRDPKQCAQQSIKDDYAVLFKIFPNRVKQKESDVFTSLLRTTKTTQRRRFSICAHKCEKPVVKSDAIKLVQELKNMIKPIQPIQLNTLKGLKQTLKKKQNTNARTETNADGSVTTYINCNDRGKIDDDGTRVLCKECSAQTELQEDKYPRYINEVICDSRDDNDAYCLTNQGACVQNYMYMNFKKDPNNHGVDNMDKWEPHVQPVRTGCHCQLMTPSAFDAFV